MVLKKFALNVNKGILRLITSFLKASERFVEHLWPTTFVLTFPFYLFLLSIHLWFFYVLLYKAYCKSIILLEFRVLFRVTVSACKNYWYVKKEIIFVSCPFNVSIITSDNYSFWVQHLFFHPIQIMRLNQSIDRKIPLCQSSVKVMWPPNSDRVFESLAFKILLLIKLKIFLEITVPDNLTPFVTLLVVTCHFFRD